jgi:hypothetical protein
MNLICRKSSMPMSYRTLVKPGGRKRRGADARFAAEFTMIPSGEKMDYPTVSRFSTTRRQPSGLKIVVDR